MNMTAHEHHHQNGRSPSDELQDSLSWTALLYSLGELPEAEAARFEERLEADSSAQAALTEIVSLTAAVSLAAGVQLAESTVAPVVKTRDEHFGRRVAGWVLLATAASVALWFSL